MNSVHRIMHNMAWYCNGYGIRLDSWPCTWMDDQLRAGKPSQYVTRQTETPRPTQPGHPSMGRRSE